MIKSQIHLIIIAIDGQLRNISLNSKKLKETFASLQVLVAITPSNLPCKALDANHSHQGNLTCNEVSAALSHQRARNIAFENNNEWTLILEDDAILVDDFFNLTSKIKELKTEGLAIGIHLFPEQFGILMPFTENFYRVIKLPDYALAYLLNREAIKISAINSYQSHLAIADWPEYLKDIKWLATRNSLALHPSPEKSSIEFYSSIERSRMKRRNEQSFLTRVRGLRILRILLIWVLSPFSKPYGNSYIQSKKFRTRILRYSDEH